VREAKQNAPPKRLFVRLAIKPRENKEKSMKKTITTAVAVFALGATLAFAGPHGDWKGGRGHKEGAFSEKMAEKLNLSDAQKAQMKEVRKAFREQNKAFFESAKATREQFHEAKKANDTAKLEALRPTMEAQRTQMDKLRADEMAQVRAILTPEQQAQFDAFKAAHKGDRRNRTE